MSTSRLHDIDRAKGLAIALVVAGHLVARTPPADNDWYVLLKDAIYLFHMPFFMFLSGLVMGHCFRPINSVGDYGKYARGKFMRLVPAYVLFGAVVLLGKALAGRFLHVDNAPDGLMSGLVDILVRPTSSCASSLWYIYVLFAYYLAFPWLMKITGGRPAMLLPVALVIHFLPVTDLFLLNRMAEYLVFVLLGAWAAQQYPKYTATVDRHVPLVVGVFAACLVLFMIPGVQDRFNSVGLAVMPKFIAGLLSIPALHGLIRTTPLAQSSWLLTLGHYTFPIYLSNTITIGLVKGVLLKLFPWDGFNFLIYLPFLLAAGLLLPILIRERFFVKFPALNAITR